MRLKFFTISLVLLFSNAVSAQCILTISGVVKDADTRLVLEKATATIVEIKKSVVTNQKGEYQLTGLCPFVQKELLVN
jgi:hypothetical protein